LKNIYKKELFMNYLDTFNYSKEEITELEKNIPKLLRDALLKNHVLVEANLTYLKDLGVENYKEIFNTYYDLFLNDPSFFASFFNKYETEDLIEKLKKNMTIIEYL